MHKLYIPTSFIEMVVPVSEGVHVLKQIVYIETNCANFDPDLLNLKSHFDTREEILMSSN